MPITAMLEGLSRNRGWVALRGVVEVLLALKGLAGWPATAT